MSAGHLTQFWPVAGRDLNKWSLWHNCGQQRTRRAEPLTGHCLIHTCTAAQELQEKELHHHHCPKREKQRRNRKRNLQGWDGSRPQSGKERIWQHSTTCCRRSGSPGCAGCPSWCHDLIMMVLMQEILVQWCQTLAQVGAKAESECVDSAFRNSVGIVLRLARFGFCHFLRVQVAVFKCFVEILIAKKESLSIMYYSWTFFMRLQTSREIPVMTSMGSITFPRDLLIFRPWASLTMECK